LEGYLRPIPGLTNFTIFPWAAFVMAGGAVGVILDAARTAEADRRANVALGAAAIAMTVGAYEASFRPPLDVRSAFGTTSASFFFIRLGLMIAALALAYAWEQRPWTTRRWSPLQVLGRSSLFIYWIHVEMVYGLVSTPLHRTLSLRAAWSGFGLFCLFMLLCAVAKDRIVTRWRGRGGTASSRTAHPAELSSSGRGLAPSR
ncbi:MAG TPA: acyltransferase family protein, partial [Vicinamibacterales bacterium]|nr:acyltransferase family protein [Vicinamibacterales bacterium]